ncbi:hypothetical protein ACH5RR_023108 [Cinchona calisaya]|uniref:Uncharacterized protein n=1 Tax=Cinchona calisaya TaxID=153742 RepID=A0ABD2ZBK5_9GENT
MLRGCDREEYRKLWEYCNALRKKNPGSCLKIKLDRPTIEEKWIFQRLYYRLSTWKDGFLAGCKPIIGLDGCFLKGLFGGQLLSAIGRDANDNMYPIALAVVEVEIYRQKGLVRTLEEEVSGAENRNVGGRGHDRKSFNAASFAIRCANSARRASGSRKMTIRVRGIAAGSARNKGNGSGMVKVAGLDSSSATPVGSAQQSIRKPPAGPAQTISKKVHSNK